MLSGALGGAGAGSGGVGPGGAGTGLGGAGYRPGGAGTGPGGNIQAINLCFSVTQYSLFISNW